MDANNKTIQFIDSDYKELFRIPDGASIKITFPPDDVRGFVVRECKYIDDYHFSILGNGSDDYHICQFAEMMEKIGAKYEPLVQLQKAEVVPFAPGEEKFCVRNREEGNTCAGHIAGDFGSQGDRFRGGWYNAKTKNEADWSGVSAELQTGLYGAVYALRQGLLKDHESMREFCQSHPEAKLPGREHLEHYGFRLDTESESSQYFIFCCAEKTSYDSRFVIFAYDNSAPVLEQKQSAVTYTLTELIEKMEPQNRRDKAVIMDCIDGLGLYAALSAREDSDSPKIAELRGLAEQLVMYWGLDDSGFTENAKPLDEFLQSFDNKVEYGKCAESSGRIIESSLPYAPSVISGLYLYGRDMVGSQGESAMSEIMRMSSLIKEIGAAWNLESSTIKNQSTRLEYEVRDMLENYPMPGNPVNDMSVEGYDVSRAVFYDSGKGFVLACGSDETSPFAVCDLIKAGGILGFDADSLRGFDTEQNAKINFIERAIRHKDLNYYIKEIPLPTTAATNGEKQSVMDEIRAAQKAPKQQSKTKQEQNKKNTDPDL